MSELEYLRSVVDARTKAPWEFRATEHSGGIKFVVAPHAPRNGNGTEFIPADCSHGFNGRFIALTGTIFDDVMRVLEAADTYMDNFDPGPGDDSCEELDGFRNALASLKAAIRAARGEG